MAIIDLNKQKCFRNIHITTSTIRTKDCSVKESCTGGSIPQ